MWRIIFKPVVRTAAIDMDVIMSQTTRSLMTSEKNNSRKETHTVCWVLNMPPKLYLELQETEKMENCGQVKCPGQHNLLAIRFCVHVCAYTHSKETTNIDSTVIDNRYGHIT